MVRPHPSRFLAAPVILAVALAGCAKAPAEPDRSSASAPPPAPAVPPLQWDAPGSWTKVPTPPGGAKKASYKIDKVGNDKEEAEMDVFFFGTGSKGDPDPNFKEWLGQFDGDGVKNAKRESLDIKGFKVDTVELSGTYKIALTPPAPGRRQPPVQMVKNSYRLYGAVVKTAGRGNWFFKIVGPDETVQAARSAFRAMLETIR